MKILTITITDEYATKLARCLDLTERQDDEDGFLVDIIEAEIEQCLAIHGEE